MSTTNRLYSFKDIMTTGIYIEVEDKDASEVVCKEIHKIRIPMIQRPYAQGRRSQEELRKEFLKDIFTALTNTDIKVLELNFIYGTLASHDNKDNVFELLDGQQRITTLFLLHYYFACQERLKNKDFNIPAYLNKFEYQTRTTSTDFISKLLKFELNPSGDRTPSKSIRSAVWYSSSFDKDSTVDAMIRMLDSIHSFYYKIEGDKPTYESLDKIMFYVLELNGFGLTEELFIKMNARGLQLTPFENFKADLVGYMKKSDSYRNKVHADLSKMNRDVEYWLNFSSLLDSKWSDLFWESPDDEDESGSKGCDIKFFRFIQRFLANKAILLTDKRVKDDVLVQYFNQRIEVERHTGFEKYGQLIKRAAEKGKDIIRQLEQFLNFLSDNVIGPVLLDSLTAPWEKERLWQPWGTVGNQVSDVGQRQMIILSAMAEYVNCLDSLEKFDEYNYKVWMRFVHIMVQSTDINGFEAQITLARMLDSILYPAKTDPDLFKPTKNIREAIIAYNQSHRNNRYLESEALKAELILNDNRGKDWEDAFMQAERNIFMQGSCTFYYQEGMDVETYRCRTMNVEKLFDANGVLEPFADGYLLIRAILCRNYDWSTLNKNAWGFTITNSGAGRYLRNLTIWNYNDDVRDFFCHLLDCNCEEDMLNYIETVLMEDHELVLKPGSWAIDVKEKLNKVYRRLYQETEFQALKWLYSLSERSMGCYFYSDGNASLYKGYVNCMFLGIERHKYIPAIIDAFKSKFDFVFVDERQNNVFSSYRNYSGDYVTIKSEIKTNGGTCNTLIRFHHNDSITIMLSDESISRDVFQSYLAYHDVNNINDYNGNPIQDTDGKLLMLYEAGIAYYKVNHIQNSDKYKTDDLIDIIQILYDKLTSRI